LGNRQAVTLDAFDDEASRVRGYPNWRKKSELRKLLWIKPVDLWEIGRFGLL